MDVAEAIQVLRRAGGSVEFTPGGKHLSLAAAGERLDFSAKYMREHLAEFPNAWRTPGGEIRIPEGDLEALAAARRLKKNLVIQ